MPAGAAFRRASAPSDRASTTTSGRTQTAPRASMAGHGVAERRDLGTQGLQQLRQAAAARCRRSRCPSARHTASPPASARPAARRRGGPRRWSSPAASRRRPRRPLVRCGGLEPLAGAAPGAGRARSAACSPRPPGPARRSPGTAPRRRRRPEAPASAGRSRSSRSSSSRRADSGWEVRSWPNRRSRSKTMNVTGRVAARRSAWRRSCTCMRSASAANEGRPASRATTSPSSSMSS